MKTAKTWGELHALLVELSEEELDKPIKWSSEFGAGTATIEVVKENLYSGEYCLEAESEIDDLDGRNLIYPKGMVLIHVTY